MALKVVATFTALVLTLGLSAQNSFKSTPGTELTYRVKTATAAYNFTMYVKSEHPNLSFDWYMSGDINQKGAVAMDNDAMSESMILVNTFKPDAVTLQGKTSGWISLRTYKLLKINRPANITFDDAKTPDAMQNCGTGQMAININGTNTQVNILKAASGANCAGGKQFTVLDDAQNPLIISMAFDGNTIELVSVKQQ